MSDKADNILLIRSIEKDIINDEKELTMTFVRNIIVGKQVLCDSLSLPVGYGKVIL